MFRGRALSPSPPLPAQSQQSSTQPSQVFPTTATTVIPPLLSQPQLTGSSTATSSSTSPTITDTTPSHSHVPPPPLNLQVVNNTPAYIQHPRSPWLRQSPAHAQQINKNNNQFSRANSVFVAGSNNNNPAAAAGVPGGISMDILRQQSSARAIYDAATMESRQMDWRPHSEHIAKRSALHHHTNSSGTNANNNNHVPPLRSHTAIPGATSNQRLRRLTQPVLTHQQQLQQFQQQQAAAAGGGGVGSAPTTTSPLVHWNNNIFAPPGGPSSQVDISSAPVSITRNYQPQPPTPGTSGNGNERNVRSPPQHISTPSSASHVRTPSSSHSHVAPVASINHRSTPVDADRTPIARSGSPPVHHTGRGRSYSDVMDYTNDDMNGGKHRRARSLGRSHAAATTTTPTAGITPTMNKRHSVNEPSTTAITPSNLSVLIPSSNAGIPAPALSTHLRSPNSQKQFSFTPSPASDRGVETISASSASSNSANRKEKRVAPTTSTTILYSPRRTSSGGSASTAAGMSDILEDSQEYALSVSAHSHSNHSNSNSTVNTARSATGVNTLHNNNLSTVNSAMRKSPLLQTVTTTNKNPSPQPAPSFRAKPKTRAQSTSVAPSSTTTTTASHPYPHVSYSVPPLDFSPSLVSPPLPTTSVLSTDSSSPFFTSSSAPGPSSYNNLLVDIIDGPHDAMSPPEEFGCSPTTLHHQPLHSQLMSSDADDTQNTEESIMEDMEEDENDDIPNVHSSPSLTSNNHSHNRMNQFHSHHHLHSHNNHNDIHHHLSPNNSSRHRHAHAHGHGHHITHHSHSHSHSQPSHDNEIDIHVNEYDNSYDDDDERSIPLAISTEHMSPRSNRSLSHSHSHLHEHPHAHGHGHGYGGEGNSSARIDHPLDEYNPPRRTSQTKRT